MTDDDKRRKAATYDAQREVDRILKPAPPAGEQAWVDGLKSNKDLPIDMTFYTFPDNSCGAVWLRSWANYFARTAVPAYMLLPKGLREAADEIERLTAENEQLKKENE